MKKINAFLCFILSIFICSSFVACKINCSHAYSLTSLVTKASSEKTGIYTCSKCKHTKKQAITYKEIGLPTIDFTGSLVGISKENELKISVKYTSTEQSFECDAKIKVQGSSSTLYPKKNYTIKF